MSTMIKMYVHILLHPRTQSHCSIQHRVAVLMLLSPDLLPIAQTLQYSTADIDQEVARASESLGFLLEGERLRRNDAVRHVGLSLDRLARTLASAAEP
jgi:hypothetical protein